MHNKSTVPVSARRLLAYLPFFETVTPEEFCKWEGKEDLEASDASTSTNKKVLTAFYPIYAKEVDKFYELFYELGLERKDYYELLSKNNISTEGIQLGQIKTANYEAMLALLTAHLRHERFCDGHWEDAQKGKVFESILLRLQELLD